MLKLRNGSGAKGTSRYIVANTNNDGTPYTVKVVRTVWSGGKVGDIKLYQKLTYRYAIQQYNMA